MSEKDINTKTGESQDINPEQAPKKTYKPTPKTPSQKKREKEDFKRKYFDYYDDIKISDRQDW